MSGGAHHNPHGRQGQPNSAWNHLQVPNFFPRPQLAHMSSDRPLSLSPLTWHTPTTTEPPTNTAPGPLYNLQQMMLADTRSMQQNPLENIALTARDRLEGLGISLNRQTSLDAIQNFTRHVTLPSAGVGSVDLTLSRSVSSPVGVSISSGMIRNGQNGESSGPISLSVRDTKQINSMDTAELNKLQTGRSLDIINTNLVVNQRSNSPKSPKPFKRSTKKMDTVLERLNSAPADLCSNTRQSPGATMLPKDDTISAIAPSTFISTPLQLPVEGKINSVLTIEDSLESVDKTRHKRKPDKTTRIEKDIKSNESLTESTAGLQIASASLIVIDDSSKQAGSNLSPVHKLLNNSDIANNLHAGVTEVSIKSNEPSVENNVNNSESENASNNLDLLEKPESVQPNLEPTIIISNTVLLTKSSQEEHMAIKSQVDRKDQLEPLSVEMAQINSVTNSVGKFISAQTTKRRSSNEESHAIPLKVRKKTSSESETIDNIAAMIASGENNSVIIPLISKKITNEENVINDSQSLANVLAGPEENVEQNLSNDTEAKLVTTSEQTVEDKQISCLQENSNKASEISQSNLNAAPQSTNFVQVENELEKMFAGIDEVVEPIEEKLNQQAQITRDNVTSTSTDSNPKRKISNVTARISRKNSGNIEITPKKKKFNETNKKTQFGSKKLKSKIKGGKNGLKNKNLKSITNKEILIYDSGSNTSSSKSKGPFIQIKGPRDSPISVSIINTSINDEDSENRIKHHKTKKHHDDAELRQKMRKGLHSSTLSMKYDATTTDVTWVCVFCKNGPHCGGTNLGDLFGPYLVTTTCPEFEYSKQNPEDDPFKSKSSEHAKNVINPNKTIKKKKSVGSDLADLDIFTGMVEASQGAYEVWGHEECIIWAPGVFLVGSRVIGLEGAVWSSCRAKCSLCNITGANVGCSQRGCDKFAHISCAIRNNWHIREDVYKATCPNHHST